MILQTLDIKDNCKGIFHESEFVFDPSEKVLKKYNLCWKHSPMLEDTHYRYLFISARSDDLSKFSPDEESYREQENLLLAHHRASLTAKVDLTGECFFNLLPEHQLLKWFEIRSDSLHKLHSLAPPPGDYDILHKAHVFATEVANQEIIYNNRKGKVLYDIFGSATGRLTTKRGSVPILTLKKEQRVGITPQNDVFIELDLNAAELRTLFALSGQDQPSEDIHEWTVRTVFNNTITRSESKKQLFSWLYNPSSSKTHFDKFFSREIFRDFYSPEKQLLETPFGRKLKVEERKAQNYLLQSTTSDIVIQNAYKIMKLLAGSRSKIAFTLHDSIIIDMAKEDSPMLGDIKRQFEETRWGPFLSTCKIGKTFGDLRDLQF